MTLDRELIDKCGQCRETNNRLIYVVSSAAVKGGMITGN